MSGQWTNKSTAATSNIAAFDLDYSLVSSFYDHLTSIETFISNIHLKHLGFLINQICTHRSMIKEGAGKNCIISGNITIEVILCYRGKNKTREK